MSNPNRPSIYRFQFRLRTLLIVAVILSLPCAGVGYALRWISQRREYLDHQPPFPVGAMYCLTEAPPFTLGLFGERGIAVVTWRPSLPYKREEVQRLFPEAKVIEVP